MSPAAVYSPIMKTRNANRVAGVPDNGVLPLWVRDLRKRLGKMDFPQLVRRRSQEGTQDPYAEGVLLGTYAQDSLKGLAQTRSNGSATRLPTFCDFHNLFIE